MDSSPIGYMFVLEAERRDSKGPYFVYFERQISTGIVVNTNKIEYAKHFLSENAAKYEIYNSGQNMEDQHYKVIPVSK